MVIIIDEAQHLGLRTIETLRSFADWFDSRGQTLGICFIGNQETVGRLGGKQKAEFAQIRNRTKQTKIYSAKQITREDMELLFPALSGKDMELDFMLKIAHSQQAVRGAVNLFSNAYYLIPGIKFLIFPVFLCEFFFKQSKCRIKINCHIYTAISICIVELLTFSPQSKTRV